MTLAYWCILLAYLLPLFCATIAKATGGFKPSDNRNPCEFLAHTQGLSARADAAQQNGFEVFAPFAAAVLVAHATGNAAQATINLLSISFIAFRIAYIFSYLKDKPSLRSAMWTGGFVCTIGLFVAAV
ncbi:MAPEG family protein [Neisseria sicca]